MEIYHLFEGIPRFIIKGIIYIKFLELFYKDFTKEIFLKGLFVFVLVLQLEQWGIYYFVYNNMIVERDLVFSIMNLLLILIMTKILYGKVLDYKGMFIIETTVIIYNIINMFIHYKLYDISLYFKDIYNALLVEWTLTFLTLCIFYLIFLILKKTIKKFQYYMV